MIAIGIWQGRYKYDNRVLQQKTGVNGTNFTIVITDTDSQHFSGTVQDDLATGGTEGIGEITGSLNGTEVEFIKQMPVMTTFDGRTGERQTQNKKHPKIYYNGTLSNDGKLITGHWKFKPNFLVVAIMFLLGIKNSGTWVMELSR